jgi:hypothetical protein
LIASVSDHGHSSQYRDENQGRRDDVVELAKGKRVTGGDRASLSDQLKKKYEGGASIRALAAETGRSYGFVHRILSESGAKLRGRGGATRKKKA